MTRFSLFVCAALAVIAVGCSQSGQADPIPPNGNDSGTVDPTPDSGTPSDSGIADSGYPVAPTISNVTATNITQTSATISWTLSEPGTGQVDYGTDTSYGQTSTPETSFNYSAHSQTITGLTANTLYHYRVTSQNQTGGVATSSDFTFTTSATAGPTISNVTATNITQTSVKISWTLNEPGTGQVEYGTTTAYGQTNTPETSFNYAAHSQPVTGLTAGTLYHYRVKSQNQAGGLSVSGDYTFTTLSAQTTTGNLPAKVVGGYFTTWEPRNNASLQNTVDTTNYNLIYVAFATGTSASSGSLQLSIPPGATSAADFKNQIAYANAHGVKVLISVGGYFDLGGTNSGYVLDSSAKVDQFMVSMRDFHDNWGFNGMDWDLEHGNRPDVAGIVDASQRMKSEFGSTWIINSAPGADLSTWVGPTGVLDTLGPNGWDAVGEQIYDMGLSPSDYQAKIVSRMTTLANKYGADKVVLGNKYRRDSPNTPDDPTAYVPISTTIAALNDLRGAGINIRGSFVWTIQSDSDQSYAWSSGVGADILSHP